MKSLVKNAYLNLYSDATKHQNWASSVNNLWVTCYMSEIWINQGSLYKNKIVKILKNFFYNKYAQLWWEYIDREESKLRKYKTFKNNISLENYLLCTNDINIRREFTKLRISAHQLHIEMGRYSRPRKTPLSDRICGHCNSREIEDEEHFILFCHGYKDERDALFANLNSFTTFESLNTEQKFHFIMSYNEGDVEILKHQFNSLEFGAKPVFFNNQR